MLGTILGAVDIAVNKIDKTLLSWSLLSAIGKVKWTRKLLCTRDWFKKKKLIYLFTYLWLGREREMEHKHLCVQGEGQKKRSRLWLSGEMEVGVDATTLRSQFKWKSRAGRSTYWATLAPWETNMCIYWYMCILKISFIWESKRESTSGVKGRGSPRQGGSQGLWHHDLSGRQTPNRLRCPKTDTL